jgi:hypothetical protein
MLVVLSIVSLKLSKQRSSNDRLYICELDKFFEGQRPRVEERFMKTIFLGFEVLLNAGVLWPNVEELLVWCIHVEGWA